ncbi:hypothetical protein QVD17_04945 [Tagetes erecta]|uniref:Uncharacterized protein n=1 Tax=Tagetes erecta TaxID=13708 RepID=A0AAD8LB35_TARER|nr:hypothetical protein QVD17_04945 [Tagetes erecta]
MRKLLAPARRSLSTPSFLSTAARLKDAKANCKAEEKENDDLRNSSNCESTENILITLCCRSQDQDQGDGGSQSHPEPSRIAPPKYCVLDVRKHFQKIKGLLGDNDEKDGGNNAGESGWAAVIGGGEIDEADSAGGGVKDDSSGEIMMELVVGARTSGSEGGNGDARDESGGDVINDVIGEEIGCGGVWRVSGDCTGGGGFRCSSAPPEKWQNGPPQLIHETRHRR